MNGVKEGGLSARSFCFFLFLKKNVSCINECSPDSSSNVYLYLYLYIYIYIGCNQLKICKCVISWSGSIFFFLSVFEWGIGRRCNWSCLGCIFPQTKRQKKLHISPRVGGTGTRVRIYLFVLRYTVRYTVECQY